MSRRIVSIAIFAILLAPTAWADDKPDYGRPGWYVGVGGGVALDFLKDAIEDFVPGFIEIGEAGSFNARGGYRILSWLALEGMYEGAYGYNVKVFDSKFADFNTHSLVGQLKLLLPIWRFHPYILAGVGAQYGEFDDVVTNAFDTNRWDLVVRTAAGLDMYVTENWLLNFEAAPSIRFADYGNIPSQTTDNVTLTLGFGVQYRF